MARSHSLPMRALSLLLLLATASVTGVVLLHGVGWDALARHEWQLAQWVDVHPIASGALFVLAYILTAALSLPQATLLTVIGGLLFGAALGCALTVIGATIGSSLLVAVLRSALAPNLRRHRHRIPEHVQTRLARDGFLYLLALRLVPLFPFWLVNLAAAVSGLRLTAFVPATLLGLLPASFVISSVGAGAAAVLAEGRAPDLSLLFAPRIFLPLLGLAGLALLPLLFRRMRAHG